MTLGQSIDTTLSRGRMGKSYKKIEGNLVKARGEIVSKIKPPMGAGAGGKRSLKD